MGLGGVLRVAGLGAADSRGNRSRCRRFPFPLSRFSIVKPPLLAQQLQQPFVRHIPRRGNDTIGWEIGSLVQLLQVTRGHGADRVTSAQDRIAVRMLGPQRLIGEIEHLIVRRVLDGVDLFEDYVALELQVARPQDRKSTRLNSSHTVISYAVFCLKKKKKK